MKPASQINGARVVCFSAIDDRHRHAGNCRQIVGSVTQGSAAGLAICQFDGEDAFYLFGCDGDWNVVTDTWHQSLDDAKKQAEFEYEGVSNTWQSPAIQATITLLRTEDGGRRNPIHSGYRPQLFFESEDFECRKIEIVPERVVHPGESAKVQITLSEFAEAKLGHRLKPGIQFELHEGKSVVAVGVVTEW